VLPPPPYPIKTQPPPTAASPGASAAVEKFKRAFEANGIFMHVTTCWGMLCPENHDAHFNAILAKKALPPPLERDCGVWCSAFTYLDKRIPFMRMTFPYYEAHVAFVYDANPEVWQKMMCAAVADSSSTTRSCCACYDERFCPFPPWSDISQEDSGYCNNGACRDDDENCKQLAAGCGVSVWTASSEEQWGQCNEESISSGTCAMCKQPLWCDDGVNPFGYGATGGIKDANAWWKEFGRSDGAGNWGGERDWARQFFGARQCKWKRTQQQQFVDTVRLASNKYKTEGYSRDDPGMWNEVNMYYGPEDTHTEDVMWRNLLGIVYLHDGEDIDRERMFQLKDHFTALGHTVPMFSMFMDPWGDLTHWDLNTDIDITGPRYQLAEYNP